MDEQEGMLIKMVSVPNRRWALKSINPSVKVGEEVVTTDDVGVKSVHPAKNHTPRVSSLIHLFPSTESYKSNSTSIESLLLADTALDPLPSIHRPFDCPPSTRNLLGLPNSLPQKVHETSRRPYTRHAPFRTLTGRPQLSLFDRGMEVFFALPGLEGGGMVAEAGQGGKNRGEGG